MPRHVLHVVDRVSGGVPVAARAYIDNSPEGFVHTVLTPFDGGAPPPIWQGITAIDLGQGHLARRRAVRSALRGVRPDVVHAHSSFAGAYARSALGRRAPRVVYSPHCFAFERRDIDPLRRAAFRTAELLLGRRTDVLAACGRGEQIVAERLRTLAGKGALVPNVPAIGDAADAPAPAWDGARLRVGMAGRISPQKDPRAFEDALGRLRTLHPDIHGVWIGQEESGFRHAFGPDVEVTGWLDRAALAGRLRGLHLYIHSAAWEGFPIAVLDAYAAGLPMLARPIPALAGLPHELTIAGGLARLRGALASPGAFAAWADENRRAWAAYLAPHTRDAQRRALARVWGGDTALSAR